MIEHQSKWLSMRVHLFPQWRITTICMCCVQIYTCRLCIFVDSCVLLCLFSHKPLPLLANHILWVPISDSICSCYCVLSSCYCHWIKWTYCIWPNIKELSKHKSAHVKSKNLTLLEKWNQTGWKKMYDGMHRCLYKYCVAGTVIDNYVARTVNNDYVMGRICLHTFWYLLMEKKSKLVSELGEVWEQINGQHLKAFNCWLLYPMTCGG